MELTINTKEKKITICGEMNAKRLLQIIESLEVDESWTVGGTEAVINIPSVWQYDDWKTDTWTGGVNFRFSCQSVN
jgi:hypothetical protein